MTLRASSRVVAELKKYSLAITAHPKQFQEFATPNGAAAGLPPALRRGRLPLGTGSADGGSKSCLERAPGHPYMASIAQELEKIRNRVTVLERQYGRDPGSVRILAVSKTKPPEAVREAAECGQREFGENHLQDALTKLDPLAGLDLIWHFIGPVQSNKTRVVAARSTTSGNSEIFFRISISSGRVSASASTLAASGMATPCSAALRSIPWVRA